MISKYIYINTQCEFIHQYKDAPDEVAFLRYPHRHLLKVKVQVEVFNEDREIEFIMLKRKIDNYISSSFDSVTNRSCENLCSMLLEYMQIFYGKNRDVVIKVSEDGENGAILSYKKKGDSND